MGLHRVCPCMGGPIVLQSTDDPKGLGDARTSDAGGPGSPLRVNAGIDSGNRGEGSSGASAAIRGDCDGRCRGFGQVK